jgi:predicted ribosomally synthesized peptide with nif11-like leader
MMRDEQLNAFQEAVNSDITLQEKLKAAVDVDAVVSIAKEAGFIFSAEDLKKAQEISDEDLRGVAGGINISGGEWRRAWSRLK